MLHRLVTAPWQEGIVVEAKLLGRFSGVFIEDSSTIHLPMALGGRWRGCGSSRGTSGSALKVFVRWNLTTGEMQGPLLSHGRTTDTHSPLSLEWLPAGCLSVADLGFYSLKRLLALHGSSKQERRFFLTRSQPGTVWQIERLFRLWKEDGQIDEWRSTQPWCILCEIYAKLCAMVIQQWLTTQGCWHDPHRSLVKAAQVVRREANRLAVAIRRGNLAEEVQDVLGNMLSGCQHNRRRARPSTAQLLEDPSLFHWPDRPVEQAPPARRRSYLGKRWPAGKGWNATRVRQYA